MTDQATEAEEELEDGEGQGEEGEGSSQPRSGKKIVLFFIVPAVVLIGIAAAVFFSGVADSLLGVEKEDAEAIKQAELAEKRAKAVFFDLPELLVNLNAPGRRTNFLKISISLELVNADDVKRIEVLMPRIVDSFQVYLRELRVSDLKGSAGIYRLREDLLRRVNQAARPIKVSDVLFKEVLVQ